MPFEPTRFRVRIFSNSGAKAFCFLAILSFSLLSAAQAARACDEPQNKTNVKWIEETLRLWEKTRKDALLLSAEKLPWIVLFDESCVWHVNPEISAIKSANPQTVKTSFNRKLIDVYLLKHDGKIRLPNGEEIPAQLMSFASSYDERKKSFMVSAMPAVWRKAPNLKDEKNLDALVRSVFVHEMTHTQHRNFYARLDEIEKQLAGVENFNDDLIQNTFGTQDAFRRAFETEHDLLYRAVAETDISRKRELAKKALDSIQSRRRQFFADKTAVYGEIEEIFLSMEGAANWAAYKSLMKQGLSEADALKTIRGKGKFWTQDEGIALFLVIDFLLPAKWQKKAFGARASSVIELLAEATR